jgi:FMN reductase
MVVSTDRRPAMTSSASTSAEVVELIGNPRLGSRTRVLADAVAAALVNGAPAEAAPRGGTRVLELAEIVGVTFSAEPARGSGGIADPHGVVRAARLLIVATPTYKGTYTGLLKIFLDQYGHRELAGTVAVPVAVAASEEHRRCVGASLRDLLVELGASVPAPPLAVLEPRLADPDQVAADWVSRYGSVVADVLAQQRVAETGLTPG